MLQSSPSPSQPLSVLIYTDGSCLGNPGPGGWAAKLAWKDNTRVLSGGFALTTNNRMEIYAAVMALEVLKEPCVVDLHTDSRYLCDAVEKRWLASWLKKNWRKADGKPVLNRDLWELLLVQLARHKVQLHWVRAHVGHAANEEVDTLARTAAMLPNLPRDAGFSQ